MSAILGTSNAHRSLRKGFAMSLPKKAAIYRYILWEQDDLIGLTKILWNKPVNMFIPSVDMKASELALLQSLPPSVHQYLDDYVKNRL